MERNNIDIESKQIIANIYKRRKRYYLTMKITTITWALLAILALVNIWFMIPCLIIMIIIFIYVKRYSSKYDELLKKINRDVVQKRIN